MADTNFRLTFFLLSRWTVKPPMDHEPSVDYQSSQSTPRLISGCSTARTTLSPSDSFSRLHVTLSTRKRCGR